MPFICSPHAVTEAAYQALLLWLRYACYCLPKASAGAFHGPLQGRVTVQQGYTKAQQG